MTEIKKSGPDAAKVFAAIAAILSARGEGRVTLVRVKERDDLRKAG